MQEGTPTRDNRCQHDNWNERRVDLLIDRLTELGFDLGITDPDEVTAMTREADAFEKLVDER